MSQPPHSPTPALPFDPEALLTKYREEREKRIRPDGNEQYVEAAGDFARVLGDPYVEPGFTRAPLADSVEVLVIGGTWYWNRYPGAQCDVESYIDLPLLEEVGTLPKEKFRRR